MKLPSITRIRKNKRFDYQPRYYNAQKDALESRVERAKREQTRESEEFKGVNFNGAFTRKKRGGISQRQLLVVSVFLSLMVYYIWLSDQGVAGFLILLAPVYFLYRYTKQKRRG